MSNPAPKPKQPAPETAQAVPSRPTADVPPATRLDADPQAAGASAVKNYGDPLPMRNGRPYFAIYGDNQGNWTLSGYDIGWRKVWDWEMAAALSLRNDGRNLSVEGATEMHPGLLKALQSAVKAHPELRTYTMAFDGPEQPVEKVLDQAAKVSLPWPEIVFYHGTSEAAWAGIEQQGLLPSKESGSQRAYGAGLAHCSEARADAVYLTTQEGMARFAALESAAKTKSRPLVLAVRGLSGDQMAPDEDSRETDPRRSLEVMGSVAFIGRIHPDCIRRQATGVDGGWEIIENPFTD